MKSKSPIRVVLVIVALLAVGAAGLFVTRTGDDDKVTVNAMFSDAYPLVPGSTVRVDGVQVGDVDDIIPDNGMAKVVMKLNREVLPIHTDARADIVIQDLLGERFIALDRGAPSAPVLPDGGALPGTQTNRVTDLQDVLNAMDNPTSVALAGLITTSGQGLRDNGQNASDVLKGLAPAMHQTDQLVKLLNAQNAQLNHLIDSAQPVAAAVSSNHGQDMDQLVDSSTNLLGAVGEQQQALRDTLRELPSSLASTQRTLRELAGVAGPTADNLGSIRPTTDHLVDISGEIQDFSDAADPSAEALAKLLPKVDDLVKQAGPVVDDLHKAGGDVRDITRSFRQLDHTALPFLTGLLELCKGWSLATVDYDAVAHYFKAIADLSPNALATVGFGPIPGMPRSTPALPLPAMPEVPFNKMGKTMQPEGPGDPRYSRPTGRGGDGATGLNQQQENSMVKQMVGGGMLGGG